MNNQKAIEERFSLSKNSVERLSDFVQLVKTAPINLTAWSEAMLWERGVFDSLAIFPKVKGSGRGLDVGSGAGFPGMVLAITNPEASWVLLDSRARRGEFLRGVVERLGLERVNIVVDRAENWIRANPQNRAAFDWVTFRAVGPTRVSLELGLPYVALGGRLFVFKGANSSEEIVSSAGFIEELGGRFREWMDGAIRNTAGEFDQIAIVEKLLPSPHKFPRNAKLLGS